MELKNRRISPFLIQCFVSIGVAINVAGMGIVMGFVNCLLHQLRLPDSSIHIDDTSGSWIASMPSFAIIGGNFIVPGIMSTFGRRIANLCSLVVSAAGWVCIVLSNSVTTLYLARFLQGIGMGMISALGPILIGEYTSPKNRGMFLMSIAIFMSTGIFGIQSMGEYLHWKTCGLICIGITLFSAVLVLLSPESPTFLADKERFDECRRVFVYLRGDTENEELEKMIESKMLTKKEQGEQVQTTRDKIVSKFEYLRQTVKKKEFYMSIFLMFHVYAMIQWCGVNMLTSYTNDVFNKHVGTDAGIDIPLMIVISGFQRIISSILGLFLIKILRRRVMLFLTIGINIAALLTSAGYAYAKEHNLLPFNQPVVGILLINIHLFSVSTGAIPLGFVLAGELFPMEYKGICSGISMVFFSLNLFTSIKTVLYCLKHWGIYGIYLLYAGVLAYCLTITGFFLPETKNKTLQDIEEELKGKKKTASPK